MIKEKFIDEEYLRKVDKEVKMIPLTFDVVFKGVFERNTDILKRFLISTLKLELDADSTKIEISNNELLKENVKEYKKTIDILVILNDTIFIDIEINRSNFESVKKRNFLYCDKLYTMLLEMGNKTSKLKDIYLYQLNLNAMDSTITFGEDRIVSYSEVTKSIYVKNKITILKYLEFYRNIYYTDIDKLSDDEIWLVSLTSRNFVELNKILTHILTSSDRSKIVKEAIRMSKSKFNLHEWEKEKMDELVREESKRIDHEEGFNAGVEQGIEQNTIEVIKNMLENRLSLDVISKVTGKTIEEIEIIKNDLNK